MRTTHELARMKAHSLGSVALYGNAGQSREGGIFSKMNTFGNLGAPRAVKAQRARNTQSTALVAKGDQFADDFYLPGQTSTSPSPVPSGPVFVPGFDRGEGNLVGKPLQTYEEWDAGNPAPRTQAEKEQRESAYASYQTAWQAANGSSSNEGGLGSIAYFGSDPSFVRREGGVMASATTFGNFAGPPASIPHSRYVAGGSIGTLAAIVVAYYGAKKLKLL